jgi:hypothetical protein
MLTRDAQSAFAPRPASQNASLTKENYGIAKSWLRLAIEPVRRSAALTSIAIPDVDDALKARLAARRGTSLAQNLDIPAREPVRESTQLG